MAELERRIGATPALPADPRSAMARVSDGRPFRPYVYGGERGPVIGKPTVAAATAARHRARDAQIAASLLRLGEESMPDIGPGPEWYRERADEDGDDLAELVAAGERYRSAQDLLTTPVPPPAPPPLRRPGSAGGAGT